MDAVEGMARGGEREQALSTVVSVRFTADEAAALRALAGDEPVSRLVRDLCLVALRDQKRQAPVVAQRTRTTAWSASNVVINGESQWSYAAGLPGTLAAQRRA